MYNIFYILLLKQNIINKNWINKNVIDFDDNNNKKYKIKAIYNSIIYEKE